MPIRRIALVFALLLAPGISRAGILEDKIAGVWRKTNTAEWRAAPGIGQLVTLELYPAGANGVGRAVLVQLIADGRSHTQDAVYRIHDTGNRSAADRFELQLSWRRADGRNDGIRFHLARAHGSPHDPGISVGLHGDRSVAHRTLRPRPLGAEQANRRTVAALARGRSAMSMSGNLDETPGAATATIAFVDLAGFSAIADVFGDAAAVGVLERFEGMVRDALGGLGPPIKWIGDEAMLAFPEADIALRVLGRWIAAD